MHHAADLADLVPPADSPESLTPASSTVVLPLEGKPATATLHPLVYRLVAAAFFWMLAVFALVFAGAAEALFMIAVSALYFAVYIGTPWLMSVIGQAAPPAGRASFKRFLRGDFETATGRCGAKAAVFQVLVVPVALAALCGAIGLVIVLVR